LQNQLILFKRYGLRARIGHAKKRIFGEDFIVAGTTAKGVQSRNSIPLQSNAYLHYVLMKKIGRK